MSLVSNSFPRERVVRTALVNAVHKIKQVAQIGRHRKPSRIYECPFCKVEKSESIVRHYVHIRSHGFKTMSVARYRCKNCRFYFTTPRWLKLHQSAEKKELLRKFRQRWKLPWLTVVKPSNNNHKFTGINGYYVPRKRRPRTTACGECNQYDGPDLTNHLARVHGLFAPYNCSKCNFRSKYYSQYKLHRTTAHKGPGRGKGNRTASGQCGECGQYDIPNLYGHLEVVHGMKRPFTCPVCNFQAKFYCQYKVHKKTHGNKKRKRGTRYSKGQCGECDEYIEDDLYSHLDSVHGLKRPFKCPSCDFKAKFYCQYRLHKKTHMNGGQVRGRYRIGKCEDCDEYEGDDLYGHLESAHGMTRPFKCPSCKFEAKFYSQYRVHKKSHLNGGGPGKGRVKYSTGQCGECGEYVEDDLYAHLDSAHGMKKPFKCPSCDFEAKFYSQYRVHKKTHTAGNNGKGRGRISTKCDECDEYEGDDLYGHLESIHGMPVPIKCPSCDFEARNYSQYKVHKKSHTNGTKGRRRFIKKCDECDEYEGDDLYGHLESVHGMPVPIKCPSCDFEARYYSQYKVHKKTHTNASKGRGRYCRKCDECEEYEGDDLYGHLESAHGMKLPFKCPSCGYEAKFYSQYKVHKKSHTNDGGFKRRGTCQFSKCAECDDYEGTDVYGHLSSVHNMTPPFQCPLCDFSHSFYSRMKLHKKAHQEGVRLMSSGIATTKCDECHEYDGPDLPDHLEYVHGLKSPFQCYQCPYSNRYYSGYKQHKKRHAFRTGGRHVKCGECEDYFGIEISQHLESAHGLTPPFQCPRCTFSYDEYIPYKKHKRTHEPGHQVGRKVSKCGECDDYDGPGLMDHLSSVHGMSTPFQCTSCNYNTENYSFYKHHKKIHQREHIVKKCYECDDYEGPDLLDHLAQVHKLVSPFKCPSCNYTNKYYSQLKAHKKRSHQTVGDYACHLCFSRFPQKFSLFRHMKSHEIRYICPVCETVVRQLEVFSMHMLNHGSLNQPMKCNNCDEYYPTVKSFLEHVTDKHQQEKIAVSADQAPEPRKRLKTGHNHVELGSFLPDMAMDEENEAGPYSPELTLNENEAYTMDYSNGFVKLEVEPDNNFYENGQHYETMNGYEEELEDEEEIIGCQFCGRIFYNENSYLIHSTRHRIPYILLTRAFKSQELPIFV